MKAIEILRKISTEVDPMNKDDLAKIVITSMASKLASVRSKMLADIVVEAVLRVVEEYESGSVGGDQRRGRAKELTAEIATTELTLIISKLRKKSEDQ